MLKKMCTGIAFVVLLAACGGGETAKEETKEPAKNDNASNPDYQNGLALVGASDCFTCHNISDAGNGPAYALVAEKYAGATDSTITRLANTIIKGSTGTWGTNIMTPHPTVSEADAKQMVKYVLLLKK